MFNGGIRGRRARDGEGNSTIRSNFVEKKFPIPFISGFEILGQSDLNIDTQGGQTVVIIGNGFESGLTLTLDGVSISPVTVISGSRVSFTAPAKSAGTYPVVISNTNGASAILVPGIIFGESPIFSTAAGNIGNFYETKSISSTVSASSDSGVTYEIVSGSIPPGSTLSSSGVLSGTAPVEANSSTYTFTVKATDEELQSSTRQFNITVNTDVVTWGYPTNGATVFLDDEEVSLNLSASSAAGYPVTYSADSLPQGFALSSNGAFTGTITEEETVSSTLTATADTTNRTASITVNWSLRLGDAFIGQTSLLLSGTASTVITDASDNQLVITPSGDFRPSALNPFDQGWATYINGSDYYEVAQNSSLAFQGGGAFTWETFINMTTGGIMYGSYTGPSNAGGSFTFASDSVNNKFGIGWIINGTDTWNFDNYSDNNVLTLGNWHHIAASYDGAGTLRYFVDGVLVTTRSVTVNVDTMVYNVRIGRSMHPSFPAQFVGWLSNMRFVKGLCLYTESFTPLDSGLPPVSGTVFLGFTTGDALYDASLVRNTIARSGTTEERQVNGLISSKITEPVSYSIYFDGVDDYIYSTTPMLPSTSTSTFTIEGWFYTPSAPGDRYMIFGDGQPTVNEFNIGVQLVSNRTLRLAWYNGSQSPYSFSCSTTGTANLNSWNWFAVVVNNNTISIYLNSATPQGLSGTTTLSNRTSNKYMMAGLQQTSLLDYLGYISNIRVSTIARTITAVPTAPYETDPDTRWLVAKSSALIDLSGNSHDPIVAGNQAKLTTANPFGYTTSALPDGLGSGYFDGTGDYITTPSNSAFYLSAGDWTVEAWVYKQTTGRQIIVGQTQNNSPPYAGWLFMISTENVLRFETSGGAQINSTTTFPLNQWVHVAAVRSSGTVTIYENGVSKATGTGGITDYAGTLAIGQFTFPVSGSEWNGYISNLRIIKGTALYTTNFVPPTRSLTKIANTQLLTLQNRIGYNNSQPIDLSGFKNVITRNGNASTGSFSPHVPTGWSGYFSGGANSDYLSIPTTDSAMHQIGDWTYEGWIYWDAIPTTGYQNVFGTGNSGQNTFGLTTINGSGWTPPLRFSVNQANIGERIAGTTQIQVGRWYHFAVVRSSGVIKLYVNGKQEGNSYNNSTDYSFGNNVFTIGRNSKAYISNFRFVRSALYNIDFDDNLPTAPFSPIAGTSLLTLRGSGFTDDGPNRFAVTRNGDTRITPFSPFKPHTVAPDSHSVYFDGTGDYLTTPSDDALGMGTGDFTIECFYYHISRASTDGLLCPFTGNLNITILTTGVLGYWDGSSFHSSTQTVPLNAWGHICVTRTSGTLKMYYNGTEVLSRTDTTNFATTYWFIGTNSVASTDPSHGYISNVRIVKGTAVYTNNFDNNLPTAPLTAISGTSLLACQSSTFVDNSNNSFTISVPSGANSQLTKFNPFGETVSTGGIEYSPVVHGGSMYFDGNSDTLTAGAVGDWNFMHNGGSFSIEAWVYRPSVTATCEFINTIRGSGDIGFVTTFEANGQFRFLFIRQDNTGTALSTINLVAAAWNHILVTYNSSTKNLKMQINGKDAGTTSFSSYTFTTSNSTYTLHIGNRSTPTGLNFFSGYLGSLRLSDTVRNSGVPTTPYTSDSNTRLLLNFANAAIQDKTGRNVLETAGNARTLPESPYRLNKSVYFDGTDDYIYFGSNDTALAFGSGDFTLEGWVNFSSVTGDRTIYSRYDQGADTGFIFRLSTTNSPSGLRFYVGAGGGGTGLTIQKAWSPVVGTWYHITVVRNSNNIYIYIDGVLLDTATSYSGTIGEPSNTNSRIGAYGSGSGPLLGYVSNLRIVKGTAITPPSGGPTSPLTAVSGTQLLTCQSYNFKDNSTNDFTITRNGDAKISSRGPFTETQTSDNAMYFDGTGDYLVGYNLDSFAVGDFTVEAWVYFNANSSTGYSTIFAGSGLSFYVYNLARLDIWPGPSPVSQVNYTFSVGQWYHIVYARSNNTFYFYVNGTRITGANSSTIYTGSTFSIGGINSPTHYLNGYIEDLRITKGVARYNLDFDPPTSRYKAK